MPKQHEADIAEFLAKLVKSTRSFQRFDSEDIEETTGVMQTIAELSLVVDFLDEYGAPEQYLNAVETAMGDVYRWISPDIQTKLLRQISKLTPTLVPRALANLHKVVERLDLAEKGDG